MGSVIAGAFLGAITQILGFFVNLAGLLTGAILWLSASILNFVLSPNFISLCYTCTSPDPVKGNPLIATGWELTRGLTNIIFVLALIAIGLGTALRIADYQAKKALPLLIIIALLINFSPVILGVIVDAANIVMNFFLSAGFSGANIFYNQTTSAWGDWFGALKNFWNPAESGNLENLMAGLAINFFNIIAAVIFFIFAFIFVMRYVVIWLLVILSPLAFASYILPVTRGFWKMWWGQFTQWTFIGVTAAFFLYLSERMIELVLTGQGILAAAPGQGVGLVNTILPWVVAIAFLFLALMMTMSINAMGSGFVIRTARKSGMAVGKFSGGVVRGVPQVSRAEERIRRGLERTPIAGRLLGGPGAYSASLARERARAGEALRGRSPAEIREKISSPPLTREDRITRARGLEMLAEQGALQGRDIRFIRDAQRYGANLSAITGRMPHWSPTVGEAIPHRIARISANQARNIQAEALEHNEVVRALRTDQIHDLTENGSTQQKQNIVNTIRNITGAGPGRLAPVPPGPPIAGIDRRVINYISIQQTTGTWPV